MKSLTRNWNPPESGSAGKFIRVFRTAEEMATQNGLLLSTAAYRPLIKPIYKRYHEFEKSKTDARIYYQSCGNGESSTWHPAAGTSQPRFKTFSLMSHPRV
jgi:hypothetical protein